MPSITMYILSHVIRKPFFGINENKDTDQFRGNSKADQLICLRYTDSTIRDFKPIAIFCGCTDATPESMLIKLIKSS